MSRAMQQEAPAARRPLWMGIAAIIVSTAAGLLLLEVFCRLVIDDGMRLDLEMWKYATDVKEPAVPPALGHVHRPNARAHLMGVDVRTNAQGFRGGELSAAKPAGVRRVLLLGDSLTMGWGVREEDTLATLVERRLNRDGRRFEVINAGVGNYNTAMEVALFEAKGPATDPDIVVLNYFINDAEPTPVPGGNWLTRRSTLVNFVAGRLDTMLRSFGAAPDWRQYYDALYRDEQPGWQLTRRSIERFAALCRARRIQCLVVNLPELRRITDYPFAHIERKVRAEVETHGLPYLDLLPALAGRDPAGLWVSPEDAHPNAAANVLFAEPMAAAIAALKSGE
jgi:lysophospholipase L1-like esterase